MVNTPKLRIPEKRNMDRLKDLTSGFHFSLMSPAAVPFQDSPVPRGDL